MNTVTTTAAVESTVATTEVNVTRKKNIRAYLEERKTLSAEIKKGDAAKRRRKAMDEELLFPLLQGSVRYLVVNAVRVIRRTDQPVVRDNVDLDALRTAFPEAYAATYKPTVYHTLTGL